MEIIVFPGVTGTMIVAGLVMFFRGKSKATRITGPILSALGIALLIWFIIGVALY